MKNYNEEELREMALQYFEEHPNATLFYATEDGNFFLEADKQHASYHANQHDMKVVLIEKAAEEPELIELTEAEKLELMKINYQQFVELVKEAIAEKDVESALTYYQEAVRYNHLGDENAELVDLAKSCSELDNQEYEALIIEYIALFDKKPASNMLKATLKKKVQEKKTSE